MLNMLGLSIALTVMTSIPAVEPKRPVVKTLDNGATVVLITVEGSKRVAMESLYSAGFFAEPRGMCQASHLLEHLACYGATGVNPEGNWMGRLTAGGIANAETLPTFVHFDAEAPAADLDWLLESEAGRMASLRITPELIAREVPRVYLETDTVESQPVAPLIKHSLMAAHQVWRYGEPAGLIRGGLAEMPIENLRAFHAAEYRPDRLTVVLVGDLDAKSVMESVEKRLGALAKPAPGAAMKTIDWAAMPETQTSRWDSSVTCVIVAWPPPANAADRLVLSAAIGQLSSRLDQDEAVAKTARLSFGSNPTWPVGELPVFLWASVKSGEDPKAAADALRNAIAAQIERGLSANDHAMIAGYLGTLRPLGADPSAQIQAMVNVLVSRQKMDRQKAISLAMLQTALQEGMKRHLLRGVSPEAIDRAAAMDAKATSQLLRQSLGPTTARTLVLAPDEAHTPK